MTYPIIAEEDLGSLYPTDYSPYVDAAQPTGFLAPLKTRIRLMFEARAMRNMPYGALAGSTGELLDVGCGRGDLGAMLIARGWKVSGIEPSEQACENARAKGVEAINGTLGTADLKGRLFNAVSFQHSLEHVFDPRVDLKIVVDHLAPGGKLVVSVPNFGSIQRKLFRDRWFHLDLARHRYHYTPEGISQLVQNAGLKVDQVSTSTSVIGLAASLSYVVFGRWKFAGGPWATRAITYTSFALLPIAIVLNKLGGGDFLHLAAHKPE